MTTTTTKTILFASLLVAMILPFSAMNFADAAPNENANDKATDKTHLKDKTKQHKENQKNLESKVLEFKNHMEKKMELQEKIEQRKTAKISTSDLDVELENEISAWDIKAKIHKNENTIPKGQLDKLMKQQEEVESILLFGTVSNSISSIGIDLATKEIQIGLNSDVIGDSNYNTIAIMDSLIPKNISWHAIDSSPVVLDGCINQQYCNPLIGGNLIKTDGNNCSMGFKASSGSLIGFVTAGHCVDNEVGTDVDDLFGAKVGTVLDEEFFWGTNCDCAFVYDSTNSQTDNKTYLSQSTQVTVTSYTSASSQSGDFIYKSGAKAAGITYGTVTGINKTLWEPIHNPPLYIKSLVQSNAVHIGGDSGGSVMSGSSIYGVISAHDTNGYYHVPTDKIMSELGISPILG